MFLNLRCIVISLAISAVARGKAAPATTTYNVPTSRGHPALATSTCYYNIPTSVRHSAALARREGRGLCNDMCAYVVDSRGKSEKLGFEKGCSSFLSTTVAHTVVTVTTTSTVAIFDNNFQHRASRHTSHRFQLSTDGDYIAGPTLRHTGIHHPSPTTVNNSIQTGTDGKFTIFPMHIPPNVPLHSLECADREYDNQHSLFAQKFSSVCSCRGVMPATTTIETATNTAIEHVSTTVPFKIKVQFQKETAVYLNSVIDDSKPTNTKPIKELGFVTSGSDAQLFTLTPKGYLESQGDGTLGWIRATYFKFHEQTQGKLVFLDESFAAKTKTAFFPQFHIDYDPEEGYELVSEMEEDRYFLWAVRLQYHNDTVPDKRLLKVDTATQMEKYEKKFNIIAEKVSLIAEPAFATDGVRGVAGS